MAFSVLSLALVAIGLYGLLSYVVTQQRREIGVRMALGAIPRSILKLVLAQGTRLVVAGIALGLIAAFALRQLLSSLLFGVSAGDAASLMGALLVLAVTAFLACFLPALRASRVDPIVALREE
jgi:ABC-type antimicrobial peptide transport system permease subunit